MTQPVNRGANVVTEADPAPELRNRTGISGSRARSAEMLAGAAEFAPQSADADAALLAARVRSSRDGLRALGGESTAAPGMARLLDRLGARLSSERMSVRLYEALLAKYDALDAPPEVPARADLERILRDEFDHYRMLEETVAELGGDPTALTPSADLGATMSRGLLEVLLDPRTHFVQGLEAALVAELTDNDAWRTLVALAERAGEVPAAERLKSALENEARHLEAVRSWLAHANGLGVA